MELIVFGIIVLVGSLALAGFVWVVIWRATGNAFDWLIHTFGNERAAAEIEEKWRRKGGGVMTDSWTLDELEQELHRFEAELRAANLAENSVRTYVDRSERFIRWLAGDYQPQGPRS